MRIKNLQPLVFCFSDVTHLCEAVSKVYEAYPKLKSSLCFYKERYFLAVYPLLSKRRPVYELLCEFGKYLGAGSVKFSLLEEHGRVVSKDAVAQMGYAFQSKQNKKRFKIGG